MVHMKFPPQFMNWIMGCLTSITYKIHVNGQIGEAFKGRRGLRQGDPLSPLLFVLLMEYFTRLMMVAGNNPQFVFHPSCKSLKLNHPMFADDVMTFCKAHPLTLSIIHHTLSTFYYCAGLQANQEKSQIVFGGCTPVL